MDMLLTLIVPALLFLALEFWWCRSARLRSGSDARRDGDPAPGPEPALAGLDPFALASLQHRLDVLAAEIRWLDDDPPVFAKAFRTHVATSAYQALLGDVTRLAEANRLAVASPRGDATVVEIGISNSRGTVREELEV